MLSHFRSTVLGQSCSAAARSAHEHREGTSRNNEEKPNQTAFRCARKSRGFSLSPASASSPCAAPGVRRGGRRPPRLPPPPGRRGDAMGEPPTPPAAARAPARTMRVAPPPRPSATRCSPHSASLAVADSLRLAAAVAGSSGLCSPGAPPSSDKKNGRCGAGLGRRAELLSWTRQTVTDGRRRPGRALFRVMILSVVDGKNLCNSFF